MMDSQIKDIDINEVKIAVVLALPRESAGARIIFADAEELQEVGVQPGFSSYLCRIPVHANRTDYHAVALALPPTTGNNHSAICVAQLRNYFKNLEHVVLCGIAGGVPKIGNPERDVYLGDIVAANKDGIFQHDFGHDEYPPETEYLLAKPRHPFIPSEDFDNINNYIISEADLGNFPWVDRLNDRLPILIGMNPKFSRPTGDSTTYSYDKINNGNIEKIERMPPHTSPKVFYGGIASGNCVLKNPFRRDKLRDKHRILAVEMEAAGLATACSQMHIEYTVVRGICDYCDSNKNDDWQYYAAATAAAYTYCVVERIPTKQQRTHKVNGEIESDFSAIERIAMQSIELGSPSASASTGLESKIVTTDSSKVRSSHSSHVEQGIRQKLHEMSQSTAVHDWENLIKVAKEVEEVLQIDSEQVRVDLHVQALYQVARAYSSWAHIIAGVDRERAISHAKQLIYKAEEMIG